MMERRVRGNSLARCGVGGNLEMTSKSYLSLQSVISRMDLIYDMEAPDLNTMVKRVMNVTGFTDEQEATKMAIVVRDVAERCRQTMITDGSCGMREFKSWVLSTMVTHDPYESALSTIISSASADPDNRAELISSCLEPQYSRTI